jgi:hypothetical protein
MVLVTSTEESMSKNEISEKLLGLPAAKLMLGFIFYVAAAILAFVIGIIISIVLKDFTHLARAGAVITIIAISMAYKDFCLNLKNLKLEEVAAVIGKEEIFNLWATSFVHKKRAHLEENHPGFDADRALGLIEEIKYLSAGEFDSKDDFLKGWLAEMFDIWSRKLREWEFKTLLAGTLLWAFSDLLNIILGWQ